MSIWEKIKGLLGLAKNKPVVDTAEPVRVTLQETASVAPADSTPPARKTREKKARENKAQVLEIKPAKTAKPVDGKKPAAAKDPKPRAPRKPKTNA